MPSASAIARARAPSREAIARISNRLLFCMPGSARSRPILPVPSTPQTTFLTTAFFTPSLFTPSLFTSHLRCEPVELVAQAHDVADDDERRRVEIRLGGAPRQGAERSGDHALRRCGPLLHDGRPGSAGKTMQDELAADQGQAQESHVDDYRLPRPRERGPVEIHAAVLQLARHEHGRLRMIA